jgi:hypothetical protein
MVVVMAQQNKQPSQPKRGGARTLVFGGLLAIVALVALWLSNCIPGFGIGSRGEGEGGEKGGGEKADADKAKPAEPESEPEKTAEPEQPKTPEQPIVRKPMPMKLTVDPAGCSVNGGDPFDCATLCDQAELFEGIDTAIVDAKNGSHGVVVEVLDCLKSKDLAVSITRK